MRIKLTNNSLLVELSNHYAWLGAQERTRYIKKEIAKERKKERKRNVDRQGVLGTFIGTVSFFVATSLEMNEKKDPTHTHTRTHTKPKKKIRFIKLAFYHLLFFINNELSIDQSCFSRFIFSVDTEISWMPTNVTRTL